MTFRIITADERMQRPPGIKGVILGPAKIGKTSLLWTLPPEDTLFLDMEAGDLSVDGWGGDSIDVYKAAQDMGIPVWQFLQAFACWATGPSPTVSDPNKPYSAQHFQYACSVLGDPVPFRAKYATLFVDSITVASRACFTWSKTQPEAFSDKTGKPNILGAYGLLGIEMVNWLTQLQHCPGKSVWFLGILEQKTDDFGRKTWEPQLIGQSASLALPGIVDQIVTMAEIDFGAEGKHRAFVTQLGNQWGFPAGDRSGQLDQIEEPHLGKLMAKIAAKNRARALTQIIPAAAPVAQPVPAVPVVKAQE